MAMPDTLRRFKRPLYIAEDPVMRIIHFSLFICSLARLTSCHNVSFGNESRQLFVPANHRMNPDENVPSRVSNETQEIQTNQSVAIALLNDRLPFNVDFVEQPEQFEMGQSFFMPTRKIPAVAQYKPAVQRTNRSEPEAHRWSVAFEEVPAITQQPPATATSLITFDDDDSEIKYNSISTVAPSQQHATLDRSSSSELASVNEPEKLRKQIEIELEKSLSEQNQLMKLLGRRIDGSSLDTGWVKRREGFVPLRQTNGFIRGHVPANHIVRHPKYQKKSKPHPSLTKLHLGQTPRIYSLLQDQPLSRSSLVPPTIVRPTSTPPEPTQVQLKSNNKNQFTPADDVAVDLNQPRLISNYQRDQVVDPQYYFTLAQQSSDSPDIEIGAGPRVEFSSSPKPSRVEELGSSGEDGADAPAAAQALDWGNSPAASELGDDETEANFEPYQHQVFTNPIMEYTGRDASKAGHRHTMSFSPTSLHRYARPVARHRPTFDYHDTRAAHMMGFRLPAASYESASSLPHRFKDYHDRQTYEVSPRLVPSASHKVIHIHTKEKKGHGKYLWPILGGGLTMLMGFLIISNLLLSIPLLAMGASSLFGHGGYHTQQLVPVYNLSTLARPPAGRRRKRWAIAELARQRDKFEFATMIRRVMASFAIRNKCKAPFGI